VGGSGCGLIYGTIAEFAWMVSNSNKCKLHDLSSTCGQAMDEETDSKHREHHNVACAGHYAIHLRNIPTWSSRHSANLLPTRSYVFCVGQTEFQEALE
jgi:hypothetical protein